MSHGDPSVNDIWIGSMVLSDARNSGRRLTCSAFEDGQSEGISDCMSMALRLDKGPEPFDALSVGCPG